MATSCGDPHHMMGSTLPKPRGLPFGLQHMRPGSGLHAMQVPQHFNTDIKDLDERPGHPDIQGGHGTPSLPTWKDLQSWGPWVWIPQPSAYMLTSHPTNPDVIFVTGGVTSLKQAHNCNLNVLSAAASELAPSVSFKYQVGCMPKLT